MNISKINPNLVSHKELIRLNQNKVVRIKELRGMRVRLLTPEERIQYPETNPDPKYSHFIEIVRL